MAHRNTLMPTQNALNEHTYCISSLYLKSERETQVERETVIPVIVGGKSTRLPAWHEIIWRWTPSQKKSLSVWQNERGEKMSEQRPFISVRHPGNEHPATLGNGNCVPHLLLPEGAERKLVEIVPLLPLCGPYIRKCQTYSPWVLYRNKAQNTVTEEAPWGIISIIKCSPLCKPCDWGTASLYSLHRVRCTFVKSARWEFRTPRLCLWSYGTLEALGDLNHWVKSAGGKITNTHERWKNVATVFLSVEIWGQYLCRCGGKYKIRRKLLK